MSKLTKKDVTLMKNDDLIFMLSQLMISGGTQALKSSIHSAKLICEELERRSVVNNANDLYVRWTKQYLV